MSAFSAIFVFKEYLYSVSLGRISLLGQSCKLGSRPRCQPPLGVTLKTSNTVFSVHDCPQEQNDSQHFSSIVRQCKWPSLSRSRNYHGNLTSHFSSLFRRASLVIIMQNTAECLKTYTKMNAVLTLFI